MDRQDFQFEEYSGPQIMDHSTGGYLLRAFPISTGPDSGQFHLGRGPVSRPLMGTLIVARSEAGLSQIPNLNLCECYQIYVYRICLSSAVIPRTDRSTARLAILSNIYMFCMFVLRSHSSNRLSHPLAVPAGPIAGSLPAACTPSPPFPLSPRTTRVGTPPPGSDSPETDGDAPRRRTRSRPSGPLPARAPAHSL
jgi:hypothetical protein